MKNKALFLVGLILIIFPLFLGAKKEPVDVDINISIPTVSVDILKKTDKIKDIVSDSNDKIELCVFNKVFADRLLKYNATQQDMNDVYVAAAKIVFENRLNDKYDGLSTFLIGLIDEVTGEDVHKLTQQEKESLQQTFYGVAQNLKGK